MYWCTKPDTLVRPIHLQALLQNIEEAEFRMWERYLYIMCNIQDICILCVIYKIFISNKKNIVVVGRHVHWGVPKLLVLWIRNTHTPKWEKHLGEKAHWNDFLTFLVSFVSSAMQECDVSSAMSRHDSSWAWSSSPSVSYSTLFNRKFKLCRF